MMMPIGIGLIALWLGGICVLFGLSSAKKTNMGRLITTSHESVAHWSKSNLSHLKLFQSVLPLTDHESYALRVFTHPKYGSIYKERNNLRHSMDPTMPKSKKTKAITCCEFSGRTKSKIILESQFEVRITSNNQGLYFSVVVKRLLHMSFP